MENTNTTRSVSLGYEFWKRTIDIIGSACGLIVLLPIFMVIAMLIKLLNPGPIFAEMPPRLGKNGKLFRMYKFRSMVKNAHYLLQTDPKFKELYEEFKKNSYKLANDPRVTPFGRFLRKTSLDETPNLINVLKGEMSLVGPRAYFPDELEEQLKVYPHTKQFIDELPKTKPGLTGLWQVSGRSAVNFDKRIMLDAQYVNKRTFWLDIKIILRTVPVFLSGKGAV